MHKFYLLLYSLKAIASISTLAPLASFETSTADLTGFFLGKKVKYTLFNLSKRFISVINTVIFITSSKHKFFACSMDLIFSRDCFTSSSKVTLDSVPVKTLTPVWPEVNTNYPYFYTLRIY